MCTACSAAPALWPFLGASFTAAPLPQTGLDQILIYFPFAWCSVVGFDAFILLCGVVVMVTVESICFNN